MFTIGNFFKLAAAVLLAGFTKSLPIFKNIVDFGGDGIVGDTFGFIIHFVIWLFVISQVLSFISFAFGGGVGRYQTTKLYRRIQWLIFTVFTCIPIWIVAFLFLNATPLSMETAEYHAKVIQIKRQRLRDANLVQLRQINEANRQRNNSIEIAGRERRHEIDSAKRARAGKVAKAKRRRKNAIDIANQKRLELINDAKRKRQASINQAKQRRQSKQDKINRDKRRLKKAVSNRRERIFAAREARLSRIKGAKNRRQSAYRRALAKRQNRFDDEWNLRLQQKERVLKPEKNRERIFKTRLDQGKARIKGKFKHKRLKDAISELVLKMARSRNMTIGISFQRQLLRGIFNYDKYQAWSKHNCRGLNDSAKLACDVVEEIKTIDIKKRSRYVVKYSPEYHYMGGLHRNIRRVERAEISLKKVKLKIARIKASYDNEFKRVDVKYRRPMLSDFPIVDLSRFPKINMEDFPRVDESLFPRAKLPDLPPVDETQFPSIDVSKFPAIDISQYPPIDMSKYPPVDMSKFPEINGNAYPKISPSNFPLVVDNSPIVVAEGSYIERLEPTFNQYYWWFLPAVLIGWILFMKHYQTKFSFVYSRIMRFLDEGRFGFGGSARFARMLEEWGSPYKAGTLYMGRSLFNPFDEIGLGGEAHMLTVAGSRGGKCTSAIIPNLLLWEGSAIVIDPKGTNAHVTANARRAMGQDVHIIDPFGIVTKDSARFDPLENVNQEDTLVRERIASITDALVIPDENAKDKHWDDGARTIISGLIAHVISEGLGEKKLYNIRDLITQHPDEQDALWADMSFNDDGGGGYAKDAAMRYIRGANTSEILGIMSSADKHTEWLSSPVMRSITSNPTFSISDIKKRPTTIYLVIPPRQLERQNRLLRLFINLVIDAMEDGGRSEIPVLMIMDEFLALGKMPEISTAFATMASYNLILWPIVQELEKLQSLYGGSFNSFIANSRAIQVFATSDQKTKEFISDRMGNRPLSGLSNIAKSNDNLPLRAPNDIEIDLAAAERRQYIIEAGKSAMLLEKVPYYDSRPISWLAFKGRFNKKYDPDPDFATK